MWPGNEARRARGPRLVYTCIYILNCVPGGHFVLQTVCVALIYLIFYNKLVLLKYLWVVSGRGGGEGGYRSTFFCGEGPGSLPMREADEKWKRKKSALTGSLPMLLGREPDERKKMRIIVRIVARWIVRRHSTGSASSAQHRLALGGSHLDRLYIGPMDSRCGFCGAFQFHGESVNCCHGGKVSLPPLHPVPVTLYNLLTLDTEEVHHFRSHIRLYNSSLAFASMGANLDVPPGHGPYCYRIHGQIYHWSGPLHPDNEQRRQFSQLYILEGNQALLERIQHPNNVSCREHTMQSLLTAIEDVSPYAHVPITAWLMERDEMLHAEEQGHQTKPVPMFFKRGHDQRKIQQSSTT